MVILAGLSDDDLNQQFWLYENTPPGHDTEIVISPGGTVSSVEITPRR